MLPYVKRVGALLAGLFLMLWTLQANAQREKDSVVLDIVPSIGGKAPTLLVNGKSMNQQEIKLLLKALGSNEGSEVILRAPDETPFSTVVQVMDELDRNAIGKVDLEVLQPEVAVEPAVFTSDAPPVSQESVDAEKVSELIHQIMQTKDGSERDLGVAELLKMAQEPDTLQVALEILIKVKDTPFERAPFLKICRAALQADSPGLLAAAIAAAPTLGATETDVKSIAVAEENESADVRKVVASGLLGVDSEGDQEITQRTIEKLLGDKDVAVVQETIRSLWGKPLSIEAEEQLIELSKTGNGEIAYDAVYYGLSTRPEISNQVAERLIQLLDAPDGNVSRRVIWALSQHPVTDTARSKVVSALVKTIDNTLNDYDRLGCITGLGLHGGSAAKTKLEAIIANEREGEKTREKAARALKKLQEQPGSIEEAVDKKATKVEDAD